MQRDKHSPLITPVFRARFFAPESTERCIIDPRLRKNSDPALLAMLARLFVSLLKNPERDVLFCLQHLQEKNHENPSPRPHESKVEPEPSPSPESEPRAEPQAQPSTARRTPPNSRARHQAYAPFGKLKGAVSPELSLLAGQVNRLRETKLELLTRGRP